jgi:predicted transcriptional regulator
MSWLKPLEGKSWWAQAGKPRTFWSAEKLAAVRNRVERRRAEARRLVKEMSHTKVAKKMGVSQSTVTRWLKKG